jgi:hypothetical protein
MPILDVGCMFVDWCEFVKSVAKIPIFQLSTDPSTFPNLNLNLNLNLTIYLVIVILTFLICPPNGGLIFETLIVALLIVSNSL